MSRLALLLMLVSACDLQPPKREAASGAPAAAAKPVEPAPAPAPAPAAPAATANEPSAECLAVASHVVDRVIANATDAERPAFEQEKTRSVRNAALACTKGAWSDEVRGCFLKSSTKQEIEDCAQKIIPAAAPPPAPPADSDAAR